MWADAATSLPSARRDTEQPSVRNKACRQRPEHNAGENTQCLCGHRNHPMPTVTVTMGTGLGTLLRIGKNHQRMQGCQPMANSPSPHPDTTGEGGSRAAAPAHSKHPQPLPDTQLVLPWDTTLVSPCSAPTAQTAQPLHSAALLFLLFTVLSCS